VFHPLYLRSCRGYSLGDLISLYVLFLWEQVRDLRIQEFLRELVVGVAAPSDLEGSILVKILHRGEGRDVGQMALASKQFSRVCDCLSLPLSLMFIHLACLYCLHLYVLDITCA